MKLALRGVVRNIASQSGENAETGKPWHKLVYQIEVSHNGVYELENIQVFGFKGQQAVAEPELAKVNGKWVEVEIFGDVKARSTGKDRAELDFRIISVKILGKLPGAGPEAPAAPVAPAAGANK